MRYEFSCSTSREGRCCICDTKWMFLVEFDRHHFNDTMEVVDLGNLPKDASKIAAALRELGDWLFTHHYSDAMPVPVYELKLSDDDTQLHIIRHKDPQMDAVFSADDLDGIADALKKASEFINKRMSDRIDHLKK